MFLEGGDLMSLLKKSGDKSASAGISNLCAISTKRLWRSASVGFGGLARLSSIRSNLWENGGSIKPLRLPDKASHRKATRTPETKIRMKLDDFGMTIAIAACTYPMRWFGSACIWLQHISKRVSPDALEFILLLISVPCFKISQFCFERAYLLNQRRLRRIGLYCASLGGHNLSIEFDELGRTLSIAAQPGKSLDNVRRSLERAKRATDVCKSISDRHERITRFPNSCDLDS